MSRLRSLSGTLGEPIGTDGTMVYGDSSATLNTPQGSVSADTSIASQAISMLQTVGQVYGQIEQQKALNQINVQRASKGLAPISAADAGLGLQVQGGLDSATKNFLMIGGAAVLAVWLLTSVLKPRRR